jgi:hypothetical protein
MKNEKGANSASVSILLGTVLLGAVLLAAYPAPAHGQATSAPDFAIKSVRTEPAEIYTNTTARVLVEVENVGALRVENAQIIIKFSQLFDAVSTMASLRPGEKIVLTSSNSDLAPGNYEVKATMVLGGSAYGLEVNLANNEKSISVQVQEGRAPGTNADLAVTDVKVWGTGNGYQAAAIVRNVGYDPASSPSDICLVTEVTKGSRLVMKREDVAIPAGKSFAAGAAKTMGPITIVDKAHPKTLERGTYNVTIGVHSAGGTNLDDLSLDNNYYHGTFSVADRPTGVPVTFEVKTGGAPAGLVPEADFTVSPPEVVAGGQVTLRWSFPEAAEAALLVDGKTIALALPSGEIKLKPACDMGGASSCTATLRVAGKTKRGAKFEREARVQVKKR